MKEITIKKHNFEQAKSHLKNFSEKTNTNLDLKKVDTGKDVGGVLLDLVKGKGFELEHTVTGNELNEVISEVQKNLIDINNMQRNFIKEIGQVYKALDALDNDYIKAILIAVKEASEASEKALTAQNDISKTIDEQKKIISVLQKFKTKDLAKEIKTKLIIAYSLAIGSFGLSIVVLILSLVGVI